MKLKIFKEKYEKGIEKKKNTEKKIIDKNWIIKIVIVTFFISLLLALLSELVIPNVYIIISIVLILIFILLGIIFDIIGVAVTTAEEKIFHSMATKKVKGAKAAIAFIKNKEKVSSFCNDVIGDICGVISGSCGLSIILKLAESYTFNIFIATILMTGVISSLTIGGKALGKGIAVNKNNYIVFQVSKFLSPIYERNKTKKN